MSQDQPLWEHQIKAIRSAEVMPSLGLFFEQGTGKTRTMIEILRRRYAKVGRILRTFIVCPVIVCENWRREFSKYSKIDQRSIAILKGTGKKRAAQLKKIIETGPNKIIVTNYETMQMKEVMALLHHWQPELLIADESQRCKNHESVRAKALVTLSDLTEGSFILTGTPILQSPMDLFMQFRILDKGKTFGTNFYAFRGKYFEDRNSHRKGTQGYVPDWQLAVGSDWQVHTRVHGMAMRVLKKDCLDLPPFVRQEVYAEMSPEQAKAYKEMQRDYIAFLQNHEGQPKAVVAQLAVVKALRLQQIVTGFAKTEDGEIVQLNNPRATVLEELLEDITPQHKVIVWANFQENYRTIRTVCDRLNLQYREIHGLIPQWSREAHLNDFRTNPGVRVLIANQAAGGVGINLVEASYSIYYSKGFRLEDDLQSEARNYRGGSEVHEKITRIDIITKDTIDELVSEALASKQSISDKILNWNLGGTNE